MKNITIAEYLNYLDTNGKPTGHGKKVFEEAYELLNGKYKIQCVSSTEYVAKQMVHHEIIPAIKQGSGKLNQKIFSNIRSVLKISRADTIWFTNTEWRLLAYLAFAPKGKRIIITMYRNTIDDIASGNGKAKNIKLFFMRRGLKRTDLVVVTNPNLKISNKQFYMPDYYYCAEQYDKYRKAKKVERVLCVGAMRKSKDLKGVVSHFSETDIPVLIVGGFSDKDEYTSLLGMKGDNIDIQDRRLNDDEYYQLIAESKYVIMPYVMSDYKNATSGILQECVFVGSVPIAPSDLLHFNAISGVGYEMIPDLPKSMKELNSLGENIENDIEKYRFGSIKGKLLEQIDRL